MKAIHIKTIRHDGQRYETVGDYFDGTCEDSNCEGCDGTAREFRVSNMGNPDFEFLVALHELIESHLVQKRGISDAAIDAFDIAYEERRPDVLFCEPGEDPTAPYHREHMFASAIERIVAHELGVEWDEYGQAVDKVGRARALYDGSDDPVVRRLALDALEGGR